MSVTTLVQTWGIEMGIMSEITLEPLSVMMMENQLVSKLDLVLELELD